MHNLHSSISDLSQHRLGSYYIRGYLQGAVQKGFDPEEILETADIPRSVYEDPTASISGEQLQLLILKIREVMNDHYMGFLQVPGKLAMDTEAAKAAVKGETLGQGLRRLLAFVNAVRSDEERFLCADEADGQCSITFCFAGLSPGVDAHLVYWYRMYWGYKFYSWLIGERIQLTQVCFSGAKPEDCISYEAIFDCAIEFKRPENKLYFDQKYLVNPILRNNMDINDGSFLLSFPNAHWFRVPGKDLSLSGQVEQILIEMLKEGMLAPSINVVSGMLNISARTLTRRLSKEKDPYQNIKSRVRCDIAKDLLLNSEISLGKIAEKIGFSEPGDFTRAFVGWTGQTPSSFRDTRA